VADEVAGLTDRQAMLLHDQVFPGRAQWPHRSASGA
jgi:hypothetical protein